MQATGPLGAVAARLGLRIVAPDRPGCGGSSFAPYRVSDYPTIMASFADTLGIDEFGVVGTSVGGRYVRAHAVRHWATVCDGWPSWPALHPPTSALCSHSRPRRAALSNGCPNGPDRRDRSDLVDAFAVSDST